MSPIHRSLTLNATDITAVDNIPITTVARTLLDLGEVFDGRAIDDQLALTRSLGLPDPRTQYYIDPGDGEPLIRADFAWPEKRIVVETDGRKTHGTRQAFETDRRRDQRLTAAGWKSFAPPGDNSSSGPTNCDRYSSSY